MDRANVEVGKTFWNGATGKWAGEQLMKALKEGKELNASVLRTLDTLRKDEWIAFDEALVEEGAIRLRAVADLIAAGMTIPVANSMGKTIFQYEKITDLAPAIVSMDGAVRSEQDRQEYELGSLPLPITHKDFFINLRTLVASRNRGEALDTTQVRTAGRVIAEETERMLFLGGKSFGGVTIDGLLTNADRNTETYIANGAWSQAAKTGENCLDDVLLMIQALEADRMYGPYNLYIPRTSSLKIEEDFKANSDKTTRQRLLEVDGLNAIRTVDQLTADNIVLLQMTKDVAAMVQGEPLQTVQWDIQGGFVINFKAFQISIPLIRSDASNRSGICHMS
jgi:uncharacterized linocin/CFP29 family protein